MSFEGMPGGRRKEMTERKCQHCAVTGKKPNGDKCGACNGTEKLRDS